MVTILRTGMGYIYRLVAPSGKAYIGQTKHAVKDRFTQHCWPSGTHTTIHQAIEKYGKDAFKVETIVNLPDELLDVYEQKFIDAYGTFEKWGYNGTRGGDWNPMHEESIRAKNKATHAKPEVKEKHKAAMKLAMGDTGVRKRISSTLKEKLAAPKARAERIEQLAKCDQTKRTMAVKLAHKRPGVTIRTTAGLRKAQNNPAKEIKRKAAIKKKLNDPEVHARRVQAIKDGWARRLGKA